MKLSGFKWDEAGLRRFFRSEHVNDLCYQKAVEHMPVSEAWINGNAHAPMREPCLAKSKRLDNTCIGLVVPKTKGAAAVVRKYGMH